VRKYDKTIEAYQVAEFQKRIASHFHYHGTEKDTWILQYCQFALLRYKAICILTFDVGYHSSGWLKNPDYEACWHLSISFFDSETHQHAPHDHKNAARIVRGIFQSAKNLVWCEPPYTENGKVADSWHYRLFVEPITRLPLLPRGEVYSREFTEAGWKSFSELHSDPPPIEGNSPGPGSGIKG
jgi:hypothetical protein